MKKVLPKTISFINKKDLIIKVKEPLRRIELVKEHEGVEINYIKAEEKLKMNFKHAGSYDIDVLVER